jgi:CBS domain-containing protein
MTTVNEILAEKGSEVVTMAADESVVNAARVMNEQGIGGVVVIDGKRMVGIFTERDILRRVVAERRDPATTRVRDVMTSPVMTCRPAASIEELMSVVTTKRIRHIPVMDGDTWVGIVTSGDLLAYQVREQADTIEFLNSYVYDVR